MVTDETGIGKAAAPTPLLLNEIRELHDVDRRYSQTQDDVIGCVGPFCSGRFWLHITPFCFASVIHVSASLCDPFFDKRAFLRVRVPLGQDPLVGGVSSPGGRTREGTGSWQRGADDFDNFVCGLKSFSSLSKRRLWNLVSGDPPGWGVSSPSYKTVRHSVTASSPFRPNRARSASMCLPGDGDTLIVEFVDRFFMVLLVLVLLPHSALTAFSEPPLGVRSLLKLGHVV